METSAKDFKCFYTKGGIVLVVSEIYKTIQGEGRLQGVPSVIIRSVGCNLHCRWCDSQISSVSEQLNVDQLYSKVDDLNLKSKYLVITGGEPLIQDDIVEISNFFHEKGYHITVETNATIYKAISCDLVSMSPKLPHSVNSIPTIRKDIIHKFISNYDYQLKFVVRDRDEDFKIIRMIVDEVGDIPVSKVLIMPLANSRYELYLNQKSIVRKCIEYGFTYTNRLQLQIWDAGPEI